MSTRSFIWNLRDEGLEDDDLIFFPCFSFLLQTDLAEKIDVIQFYCVLSQRDKIYFRTSLVQEHVSVGASWWQILFKFRSHSAESWKMCHFCDLIDAIRLLFNPERKTSAEQWIRVETFGFVLKNYISLLFWVLLWLWGDMHNWSHCEF